MPDQTFDKVDLVVEQLDCACELFNAGRFIPAITLGGAAESLSEEILRAASVETSQQFSTRIIKKVYELQGELTPSDAKVMRDLNFAKNSLKHHNSAQPLKVIINAEFDAFMLLHSAIDNMKKLGKDLTDSMKEYEKYLEKKKTHNETPQPTQ